MLRQMESPHVFYTKSANELNWNQLIKHLLEKDKHTPMSMDDAKKLSRQEKYAVLKKFPIDVAHHFDQRFNKILKTLQKPNSLGQYKVVDYFYRIEFQQRGNADAHCVLWLADEDGNPPPSIDLSNEDSINNFSRFVDSIIRTKKANTLIHLRCLSLLRSCNVTIIRLHVIRRAND